MPFPALLNTGVAQHLGQYVGEQDDALLFTSPAGVPMRHSNFYRRAWLPAIRKVGRPGSTSTISGTPVTL